MNELISFLNKWFEGKIKSLQLKKTVAGKVISVSGDMTEATVELPNTGLVKLLNKSGEELSEGDSVWVEYRTKPSSGVIAMRNGKAKPLGGDGGSKYIYVGNAVALTHKQAEEYYFADKLLEKVYVNNNNVIIYDFPGDHIIIDGKPAVWLDSYINDEGLERYKSIAKPSDAMTECSFALAGKSGKYFCRPSSFGYSTPSSGFGCRCQAYYATDSSTQSISYSFVDVSTPPALMGIVVCIRSINAPSTTYPYGYATGTLGVAVFDSAGAILDARFVSSAKDHKINNFPFASQAEYDAAVGIVARLDVQPSEASEAIAEVLGG